MVRMILRIAMNLRKGASRILHIVQIGTDEDRAELASKIIGVDVTMQRFKDMQIHTAQMHAWEKAMTAAENERQELNYALLMQMKRCMGEENAERVSYLLHMPS